MGGEFVVLAVFTVAWPIQEGMIRPSDLLLYGKECSNFIFRYSGMDRLISPKVCGSPGLHEFCDSWALAFNLVGGQSHHPQNGIRWNVHCEDGIHICLLSGYHERSRDRRNRPLYTNRYPEPQRNDAVEIDSEMHERSWLGEGYLVSAPMLMVTVITCWKAVWALNGNVLNAGKQ
ncbi:hypothetical protein EDC04DRAFT_1803358 [Pisolithus marmoratus]|nr:hypothetical protein EDC04DRAFT_1803358 [Pisolithus marmoratus]